VNDCCKDYENYCLVSGLKAGQNISAPKLPEFNISAKDIRSYKSKYAMNAKPAPPLPASKNGTTPGCPKTDCSKASSKGKGKEASNLLSKRVLSKRVVGTAAAPAAFLQRQAYPDFDKISDLLEPKIADMVKRLEQIPSRISGSGRKLLQALEIFSRAKPSTNHSTTQAKARVDTLVKNLIAVRQQVKAHQDLSPLKQLMAVGRQVKAHQEPPPPPPPLLDQPPPPPPLAASPSAVVEELGAESAELGQTVGEINNDVNDMFHLLEEAEYWNHKAPMLKSAVFDFASHYQASLHNLAIVSGLIAGGPAGAPGAPGAPGAAPAGHAPARYRLRKTS
jgi:hypothetical protein